jgi:hypothetical protein
LAHSRNAPTRDGNPIADTATVAAASTVTGRSSWFMATRGKDGMFFSRVRGPRGWRGLAAPPEALLAQCLGQCSRPRARLLLTACC